MFYIDFGDFPINPLYFGFNSGRQENPVFRIFDFQGPSRTQKDLGFFSTEVFCRNQNLQHLDLFWRSWRPKMKHMEHPDTMAAP